MEERKNTAELAHFIRILPFNMIEKYVFLNLTIKEVSALIIDFGIVQLIPLFFIHRFYKDLDSIFDEIDFTQLEPKHEKFIFHYFDYIEKEPFKLLNLIINKKYFEKRDFYEPNMHKWLKYHKERYAKCIKFYDEYVILIRFLLEFMNNTEIINLFYQLSDDLQEIILMYARQTVSEPVKTHYWTTSLQLIALWDAMTRKDIQLEIARQINIIDVYQPGMRDILDMIDQAERLRNHEIAQEIVKDFLKPFNYVRQNQVSFSGLYNNPQFSDMTIETENDILKVHRVILRTVPRLHKYFLNKGPHIILKGKKTAKVKQLIKLAYDCFHFEEFIYPNIPKLLHRSFFTIFNNAEDSDFLIESKNGSKIYLHKAILQASGLEYFKKMITIDMKENRESKLIVEEDDYDILKVILEYVYTDIMPEFDNDESKLAFEQALGYYSAQA